MIFTVFLYICNALLITIISLLSVLYLYLRWQYKYWEKKKVSYTKPAFPLGNLTGAMKHSVYVTVKKLYHESKQQRYQGIWFLHKPVLMINDPDLVGQILIKNFADFYSNGTYLDKDNNPFSETLFTLEGAKWKNMRAKLSPIFTSGKLKSMFPNLVKCGENMTESIQDQARMNEVVDAKEFVLKFTSEVVFSVVFGIEINFLKNADSIGDVLAKISIESTWLTALKFFFAVFVPDVAKVLKYTILPKKTNDFLLKLFQDIVDFRENNNFTRSDIMQILIDLLRKGYVDDIDDLKINTNKGRDDFKFKDLASQAVMFLTAGFQTSTKAIEFAVYELAKNMEIQRKLQNEIKEVLARHNGQMTYEAIFEMEYLSQIIDETLRKYSVIPLIPRKCAREFKVPNSDLVIEKGEYVIIPVAGLHSDERYYPEPEKFDPDRFTKEKKASRPNGVYLPFGDGPRFCVGQRFGQLQIRMALVILFSKFDFGISEKSTPDPLEFEPKSLTTFPKGKLMLKISHANA